MEQLNIKFDQLNVKMDQLIIKMDQLLTQNKVENKIENKIENFNLNWSIQNYKNCVLVQFPFNSEFKDYVKEIGGKWNNIKKAWIFPRSNETFVDEIKDKFPNWEFKDLNTDSTFTKFTNSSNSFIDEE